MGKGDWVKQDIDGKEKIDETGTVWLMDAATGEWRVNPDEREQPRQSDKCLTEMDNASKASKAKQASAARRGAESGMLARSLARSPAARSAAAAPLVQRPGAP